MARRAPSPRTAPRPAAAADPGRETWQEQVASFVGFFIYLLILKSFFLPLFVIPTGSMAQALYGAHAFHTCPNCGHEFALGWQVPPSLPRGAPHHPLLECPNCRWREQAGLPTDPERRTVPVDQARYRPLRPVAGDRIFVHGWPFERLFADVERLRPQRWDVVVFKVPTDGQTNYIKRLVGKPNETIEIIDGDIFVDGRIAPKPAHVQAALWFPYYDHDHPPRQPSRAAGYFPRWAPLDAAGTWTGLTEPVSRVIRFDGLGRPRSAIQFATDPRDPQRPGIVQAVYGYNEPDPRRPADIVPDVRLSAEIEIDAGDPDGYVELGVANGGGSFQARLTAGGRVQLRSGAGDAGAPPWAECPAPPGPVHLALCHLDGQVFVEINGRPALRASAAHYDLTPDAARQRALERRSPRLRIAAAGLRAALRHVLIERDVYYTSDMPGRREPAHGVQGQPIRLADSEYFLLGDNSPNSLDGRFAFANSASQAVGPHLKDAFADGEFHPGTVPADQLIGPAFFVYWPGALPLTSRGPNILPDFGHVRWIR